MTASGEAADLDILNHASAIQALGGDVELYRELLEIFLEDADAVYQQLQKSIHTGACEEIRRTSHKLKGMAISVGASQLAELCHQIEQNTNRGQELSHAVQSCFDETLTSIRDF